MQEDPEFFDVLCDYFHHGDAKYVPAGNLDNEGEWQDALQKCFAFIRFTDMYDTTEASMAVREHIWLILSRRRFDDCVVAVGAEELQFCIKRLHPENSILKVLANICLCRLGESSPTETKRIIGRAGGLQTVPRDRSVEIIHELMHKNDNFATAMARQITTPASGNAHIASTPLSYNVSISPFL